MSAENSDNDKNREENMPSSLYELEFHPFFDPIEKLTFTAYGL